MPGKHIAHCSICGKGFTGNFKERMAKLRRHRKLRHPTAHKRSVKKAQKTKATHDPKVIKVRRHLISRPGVQAFKDYTGRGLVRLLHRTDKRLFPELALYVKFRGLPHDVQDRMLMEAGLREEPKDSGKWVLRSDKFSIFLYV